MKKTLVTCLAVVALFAIASSAVAITCTVDKRPAATLLVPYFASSFNTDGSVDGTGVDTIVTIATSNPNVASAPAVVTIPAGQVAATFGVSTGAQGVATLTIEVDGEKRDLTVVVGTPPAGMVPAIVAPVVGIKGQ